MRVGVVEIMDSGHITLAETICRIFCCRPENQVYLFTLDKHAINVGFLTNIYSNIEIVIWNKERKPLEFLQKTGGLNLDRIYIVTLTKYFRQVSKWNVPASLFLTIHNTDEWFGISLMESFRKFFYFIKKASDIKLWIYYFKLSFISPAYKRVILKTVNDTGGSLVVLSETLKKELKELSHGMNTEVIPFAVFDDSILRQETQPDGRVRICVPGILSQYRRNYSGLLELIENRLYELRQLFVIDFLGGIPINNQSDNPAMILRKVESLNNKGYSIIIHNVSFIPPSEYYMELAKADIILGNMNVTLTRFSTYGKTKETGVPFAMIQAAKPGILPSVYEVIEELRTSSLFYKDFNEMGTILEEVITNNEKLAGLKQNALQNSYKFTPELVYQKLTEKTHL